MEGESGCSGKEKNIRKENGRSGNQKNLASSRMEKDEQ